MSARNKPRSKSTVKNYNRGLSILAQDLECTDTVIAKRKKQLEGTNWEVKKSTRTGLCYYTLPGTQRSQMNFPILCTEEIKQQKVLPKGWEIKTSRTTGECYYFNEHLGISQYELPNENTGYNKPSLLKIRKPTDNLCSDSETEYFKEELQRQGLTNWDVIQSNIRGCYFKNRETGEVLFRFPENNGVFLEKSVTPRVVEEVGSKGCGPWGCLGFGGTRKKKSKTQKRRR
jgi:hypothetical protein